MKERDARFKRGMAMLKKMGRAKTMMDQKALDPDQPAGARPVVHDHRLAECLV